MLLLLIIYIDTETPFLPKASQPQKVSSATAVFTTAARATSVMSAPLGHADVSWNPDVLQYRARPQTASLSIGPACLRQCFIFLVEENPVAPQKPCEMLL